MPACLFDVGDLIHEGGYGEFALVLQVSNSPYHGYKLLWLHPKGHGDEHIEWWLRSDLQTQGWYVFSHAA